MEPRNRIPTAIGKNPKWTSIDHEMPLMFDLCVLRSKDGSKLVGWWTGMAWDGPREIDSSSIVEWKSQSGHP